MVGDKVLGLIEDGTILTGGVVGEACSSYEGFMRHFSMSTKYVNLLAVARYPRGDTAAMKQAGDRVTNARKHFGTLCRGDKETSRRGRTIGKTMKEHITGVGLDMNIEDDVNALNKILMRAHWKGVREFRN